MRDHKHEVQNHSPFVLRLNKALNDYKKHHEGYRSWLLQRGYHKELAEKLEQEVQKTPSDWALYQFCQHEVLKEILNNPSDSGVSKLFELINAALEDVASGKIQINIPNIPNYDLLQIELQRQALNCKYRNSSLLQNLAATGAGIIKYVAPKTVNFSVIEINLESTMILLQPSQPVVTKMLKKGDELYVFLSDIKLNRDEKHSHFESKRVSFAQISTAVNNNTNSILATSSLITPDTLKTKLNKGLETALSKINVKYYHTITAATAELGFFTAARNFLKFDDRTNIEAISKDLETAYHNAIADRSVFHFFKDERDLIYREYKEHLNEMVSANYNTAPPASIAG